MVGHDLAQDDVAALAVAAQARREVHSRAEIVEAESSSVLRLPPQ